MRLKEILSNLTVTPSYFDAIMTVAFVLTAIAFIATCVFDENDGLKLPISVVSMRVFLVTGVGVLSYTENAKIDAVKEAKITRSGDKIHVESDSEFMKSVDLDVVAEKDGYIYVEFNNKTYRIEDLSKKGK